jgi:hypothetical protein
LLFSDDAGSLADIMGCSGGVGRRVQMASQLLMLLLPSILLVVSDVLAIAIAEGCRWLHYLLDSALLSGCWINEIQEEIWIAMDYLLSVGLG